MDFLRMLTLAPATPFNAAAHKGTIHPGAVADLTIPASDPAKFCNVAATIRTGRVIYIRAVPQ